MLIVASIVLVMGGMEFLLRFLHIPSPYSTLGENRRIFSCYRPDATTIYQTIPGNNTCGSELISADGFRLHPGALPVRDAVIVLGDSFVFGNYVDSRHTVPAYLQDGLNNRGDKLNVINAGVPGFGIDQEYVQLVKNLLPRVSPKVVLWIIHENDWDEYDYGCLVTVNNSLRLLPAWKNTLFWYATAAPYLPTWILQSRIYALIRSAIPENFTFGCSSGSPISIEQQNLKKERIFQSALDLAKKNNFALRFVYVQSQHAYSSEPPPTYEEETRKKLLAIYAIGENPLIASKAIKDLLTTQNVLGSSTESTLLDKTLFVLDDPSGYGGQHMNEEGNRLFADILLLTYLQ